MNRFGRGALIFDISVVVIAIDQMTKNLVLRHFADGARDYGPLTIGVVYNRGAAFGLGAGLTPYLLVIGAIAVVVSSFYLKPLRSLTGSIGVGLIVGGALGNLADRVFRSNQGAVVDFLDFHWWPVFNVADAAIVVGVLTLLFASIEREEKTTE